MKRSFIERNSTDQSGGGIRTGHDTVLTLENDVIAHNSAGDSFGGVWMMGKGTLINVTLSDNAGAGAAFYANFDDEPGHYLTVTNSILYNDTATISRWTAPPRVPGR